MAHLQLVPLDRFNWETCLSIRLRPDQEVFVPPILYSLAQAKFEALTPFGIQLGEDMIGFLMSGEFGGVCWLTRVIIDRDRQGFGFGSEAVQLWLRTIGRNPHCKEVRTSYARENGAAAHFFQRLGFVPLGDSLAEEVVARFEG
ncbi:MAG: GNAT family N-acetyltransferase [Bacteroidota bacterium]